MAAVNGRLHSLPYVVLVTDEAVWMLDARTNAVAWGPADITTASLPPQLAREVEAWESSCSGGGGSTGGGGGLGGGAHRGVPLLHVRTDGPVLCALSHVLKTVRGSGWIGGGWEQCRRNSHGSSISNSK